MKWIVKSFSVTLTLSILLYASRLKKSVTIVFRFSMFSLRNMILNSSLPSTKSLHFGQYLRWNSFNPRKQKISLINTLVHRALMICSKGKLSSELDNIRSIMAENGYPDHVVNSSITRKIRNFRRPPSYGPKKCPVYLHLPWLGAISARFEKQVASAVQRCYFSVEPRVVFTTRQLLPASKKDVLPASQQSNIVYEFSCHCDSQYVGRTSQRLQNRIK